ncbi:5'-nucleotidase, lipoprotein e(P4) family [Pseudoluteimonas lycopersici]|uniref:5'-nucleotidase, lipoprotein e(P4) family n=1 Tax=Pseudoluteimonas lycopersici TaxID=1324796 RepID=A0A516V6M2_9GAMM|nr:5'-nucleotidase, lipoprotein e(P4) family [Lysobacter lycopersici]QDQ74151.1 5'-nucleotidase, lipoprotein e(P4) family [Lysobacter lycopersici]
MPSPRTLTLLACALALAACKPTSYTAPAAGEIPPPKAAAVDPAKPNDNLNAVLWMQDSAEYGAVCETIYRAATAQLDAALADKTRDALVPEERGNAAEGLPPAVVMDVDETVLDNSPYQARLIANGKEYDDVSWDAWVAEKKAQPLPGVVAFAQAAAAKGITVLYLSNRDEHLQAATIANLKAVGLPVKDDSVFLGLGTFVKDCEQNGSEKNCRRRLAGQKYRVLMQFGDQLGDFVQVLANAPKDRGQLAGKYRDWFGQRWWMLPNPSYGSWEPAVFNNDWAQPQAKRRAAKRAALDLAN